MKKISSCKITKFDEKGKEFEGGEITPRKVKKESSFRRSLKPQHKKGEVLSREALTRMMLNF